MWFFNQFLAEFARVEEDKSEENMSPDLLLVNKNTVSVMKKKAEKTRKKTIIETETLRKKNQSTQVIFL